MAIFALVLAAFVCAAAFWLGWGRRADWKAVTGRDLLDEGDSARFFRPAPETGSVRSLVRWYGHATVSVGEGASLMVVDPVVSNRIQVAPRRFDGPVLDPEQSFAGVFITHAHMDHLDNGTLERMPPTCIFLPRKSERFLSEGVRNRHQVRPLDLGEPVRLGDWEVIPVPARHGGWRFPWQRGHFACGYVFRRDDAVIYVAGDTAMGDHFAAIASDYAPDVAVLPIGAYSPQWFLRSRHLNPEEAVKAAEMLGVKQVVPYHFGTYRLSLERMDAPLRRFASCADAANREWYLPAATETRPRLASRSLPPAVGGLP